MTSQSVRTGCVLLALALALQLTLRSLAGETWDGGGANNNWTTVLNWNSDGPGRDEAPPNDGTADILMAGTTRLTPLVNVAYDIRSLTFNSNAGAFVILGAQELTIGAGGVTNNDADRQSVIGPVRLAADQTWSATNGPLQMDVVNLNGFDLTFAGGFGVELVSGISGSGDLFFRTIHTPTVIMAGPVNNTYQGITRVDAGTLLLQKSSGAVAIPGQMRIGTVTGPIATVRLGANEQIAHAAAMVNHVHLEPTGRLDLNGHVETIRSLHLEEGAVVTTGTGRLIPVAGISGNGTVIGNIDLGGGNPAFTHGIFGIRLVLDGTMSNGSASFGGTVRLQGPANTYSGLTTVSSTSAVELQKSAVDGAFRGDVTIRGSVDIRANEQILAAAGNEVFVDGGELRFFGFSETLQDLTLKDGTVNAHAVPTGTLTVLGEIKVLAGTNGSDIRPDMNLQGARTFNVEMGTAPAWDLRITRVVSNGSVMKTGVGRMRLENSANTYAGGTFVHGGTIIAAVDASLGAPSGGISLDGGVLSVDGTAFSTTARSISWGANGGGFDVSNAGGIFTLATQSFTGPGPLTKIGPGKLVLVAPQSYAGGTTVAAGTLEGNSQSLQGNIVNNGTLVFNQQSDGTYAGNITGTGAVNKSGAGLLALSGANSYGGATTISDGALVVASVGSIESPNIVVTAMGELAGNGDLIGNVQNNGRVSSGASIGALRVDGGYSQNAAGELLIELADNSTFDQLLVTGEAELGGSLKVALLDDFIPAAGSLFEVLHADGGVFNEFATTMLPALSTNLEWNVIYSNFAVLLEVTSALPGDYNQNGVVDAADYVVWRKNDGTQQGYDNWRANFGRIAGEGAASNASSPSRAAVPEPRTALLLAAGLMTSLFCVTQRGTPVCLMTRGRQPGRLMSRLAPRAAPSPLRRLFACRRRPRSLPPASDNSAGVRRAADTVPVRRGSSPAAT